MLKLGYVHVKMEHYEDAIDDFTRLIRRNKKYPGRLLLPGICKTVLVARKAKDTCRDLSKAAEMGHVQAAQLLQKYCQ